MTYVTIVYLVTVNGKPERVFREEHKAKHYIDHHSAPNLCEICEVPLIE